MLEGSRFVLAAASMRTKGNSSHVTAMNLLLGDGSVKWKDDVRIRPQLPFVPLESGSRDLDVIYDIFGIKF